MATDGVVEGIKEVFDANADLKAAGYVELYAGRAPKTDAGFDYPYAIVTRITRSRLETTTDQVFFDKVVQVTLRDRTEEEVAAHAELFYDTFPESVQLSLGNSAYSFKWLRTGTADITEEGDRVWKADIECTVRIAKAR